MKNDPATHPCYLCKERRYTLNGFWCLKLKRYVQYAKVQPCKPLPS